MRRTSLKSRRIVQTSASIRSKTVSVRGKRLSIWIPIAVAIIIVGVVSAAIVSYFQYRPPTRGYTFTGSGNKEITDNHIRLWTGPTANTWSGMITEQTWKLTDNFVLTAQVNVTSLTNTFYGEVILVDQDIDTGVGFQLTPSPENKVRIKGWTWDEENELFTTSVDKQINLAISLQVKEISSNQIEFYVDGVLLDTITTNFPSSPNAVFNVDISNGSQGGNVEMIFNFEVQQNA